jgi:phosphoribosylformylglycinamidine synthase
MVGVLDDVRRAVPAHFANPGDTIVLLGVTSGHLGGSAYWADVLGDRAGAPPPVDLEAERGLVEVLVAAAAGGLLSSGHDVSDGGLGVAIAEACIGAPYAGETLGADVDLTDESTRLADGPTDPLATVRILFAEDHGRAVVSTSPEHTDALLALAERLGVTARAVGTVGAPGSSLVVRTTAHTLDLDVNELRETYYHAIPTRMETVLMQGASS